MGRSRRAGSRGDRKKLSPLHRRCQRLIQPGHKLRQRRRLCGCLHRRRFRARFLRLAPRCYVHLVLRGAQRAETPRNTFRIYPISLDGQKSKIGAQRGLYAPMRFSEERAERMARRRFRAPRINSPYYLSLISISNLYLYSLSLV